MENEYLRNKSKKVVRSFNIDEKLLESLKNYCKKNKVFISSVMEQALLEFINKK